MFDNEAIYMVTCDQTFPESLRKSYEVKKTLPLIICFSKITRYLD
jgi:hypothetical protein